MLNYMQKAQNTLGKGKKLGTCLFFGFMDDMQTKKAKEAKKTNRLKWIKGQNSHNA